MARALTLSLSNQEKMDTLDAAPAQEQEGLRDIPRGEKPQTSHRVTPLISGTSEKWK